MWRVGPLAVERSGEASADERDDRSEDPRRGEQERCEAGHGSKLEPHATKGAPLDGGRPSHCQVRYWFGLPCGPTLPELPPVPEPP